MEEGSISELLEIYEKYVVGRIIWHSIHML